MTAIAVLGGTGLVGRHVLAALRPAHSTAGARRLG